TLALEQGQMPASAGFSQPSETIAATGGALQMLAAPIALRPSADAPLGLAGVSALTQRGLAYHVLIERPEINAAVAKASSADWRILRLSAASAEDLVALLARSCGEAESLFGRSATMHFHPGDRVRLGIIADCPEALGKKLRLA